MTPGDDGRLMGEDDTNQHVAGGYFLERQLYMSGIIKLIFNCNCCLCH